jgi:hypothetical protein
MVQPNKADFDVRKLLKRRKKLPKAPFKVQSTEFGVSAECGRTGLLNKNKGGGGGDMLLVACCLLPPNLDPTSAKPPTTHTAGPPCIPDILSAGGYKCLVGGAAGWLYLAPWRWC